MNNTNVMRALVVFVVAGIAIALYFLWQMTSAGTISVDEPTSSQAFHNSTNEVNYGTYDLCKEVCPYGSADTVDYKGRQIVCRENCPYSTGASGVYYEGAKIIGADPGSFELVGYGLIPGKGADAQPSQPEYARDTQQVFFLGKPVLGADPMTFVALVSGDLTPKFQTTFWTRLTARIISYDTTSHHS